jgi:hypothetical protein
MLQPPTVDPAQAHPITVHPCITDIPRDGGWVGVGKAEAQPGVITLHSLEEVGPSGNASGHTYNVGVVHFAHDPCVLHTCCSTRGANLFQ